MLDAEIKDKVRQIIEVSGQDGWIEATDCADKYSRDSIRKTTNIEEKRIFYRWLKKVMKGQVQGFQVFKCEGYRSLLGLGSADPKIADKIKKKWELYLPRRELLFSVAKSQRL